MNTIGESIRKYRESSGISVRELAKMTNINYSLLYQYERGVRRPSYDVLKKISDKLNLPIECFLSAYVIPTGENEIDEMEFGRREDFQSELFYWLWNERCKLTNDELDQLQNFVQSILENYTNHRMDIIISLINSKFLSDDDLEAIANFAKEELSIREIPSEL